MTKTQSFLRLRSNFFYFYLPHFPSQVLAPTAPDESSSSDDPLFAEPIAPTLSLGERIAWIQSSGPEFGLVKWIGRMPQISLDDWTVGIEFVRIFMIDMSKIIS